MGILDYFFENVMQTRGTTSSSAESSGVVARLNGVAMPSSSF